MSLKNEEQTKLEGILITINSIVIDRYYLFTI